MEGTRGGGDAFTQKQTEREDQGPHETGEDTQDSRKFLRPPTAGLVVCTRSTEDFRQGLDMGLL